MLLLPDAARTFSKFSRVIQAGYEERVLERGFFLLGIAGCITLGMSSGGDQWIVLPTA